MESFELNKDDRRVLEAAVEVIKTNYDSTYWRHTVGAAILGRSGKIYSGVNVHANCGFGPCAEPVVLGSAISSGERQFEVLAAVGGPDREFVPIPPCGNCRQLLLEYCPELMIILKENDQFRRYRIGDLLPLPYKMAIQGG